MSDSNGFVTAAIQQAIKTSGLPAEKIEEMTSMMVKYLNTGAKYGHCPDCFLRWYYEQGGRI